MKAKNKSAYHWVILVCCILTLMFAYSTRVSLAQLFSTEILKETGFSTGAYFLTSMITSILCIIASPIIGKMLRGKYMRIVFIVCCIGTMGTYMCYGLCHELWQFYIVAALVGVFAMGAGTIPVTLIITNWFEKNRGLMISVALMGISIGGMVLSPILSAIIGQFGWRKAYFILGIVSLIVLIPISVFIVRRTPEDAGLLPYGQGEEVQAKEKIISDKYLERYIKRGQTDTDYLDTWHCRILHLFLSRNHHAPELLSAGSRIFSRIHRSIYFPVFSSSNCWKTCTRSHF